MKTNLFRSIGYSLLIPVLLLSCTKDTDKKEEPAEDTPATIYISGYTNETTHIGETIWKNGTPHHVFTPDLLTSNYVRYADAVYDIDISNNNVYAVWRMNHKARSAYYPTANIYLWKNDYNTAVEEGNPNIHPRAVAVEGNDIYYAGYYVNQYEYPNVWKNGNREQLPGGIGSVLDLVVNNSDVLAVGRVHSGQSSVAAFWKNGVLTKLAEGEGGEFAASGIVLANNNIYIAGEGRLNGVNSQRSALLWKNGIQQVLENPNGQTGSAANAVTYTDNGIYVAGYSYAQQLNNDGMRATVWINGNPKILSGSESNAFSVAAKGNAIYVCGFEKPAGTFIAVMWKITPEKIEVTKLSNGTADARAYCIKVK